MAHPLLQTDKKVSAGAAATVHLARAADAEAMLRGLPAAARAHLNAIGFKPKSGQFALAPDSGKGFAAVFVLDDRASRACDRFQTGRLPGLLPPGLYRINGHGLTAGDLEDAALAWLLGSYRFTKFKQPAPEPRALIAPEGVDASRIAIIAAAVNAGRDLVNRPANDLGPAELSDAAKTLAGRFGARFSVTVGDALLKRNFPMVHAVGRASPRAPRLIDFTWGSPKHPKVTLVGKGVCFDTGGLDIKPSSAMLIMKKDMGGAATALAAAQIIMALKLPVRLRVIIPAVENVISGNAFKPGDILASRKGISVEIGNTDAEGRLVLGDALALADEERPDLIMDYATLTGAARVALGPDLPPFFTDDDALAASVSQAAAAVNDPVWRLPLWPHYDAMLDSKVADINHVSQGGFAGSITAALFLRRFVTQTKAWAHFDVYNWVPSAKPGRPDGGDVQAARLTAALIETRYRR